MGIVPGGAFSEADRRIQAVATGAQQLAADELQEILEHVARAGFFPPPHAKATGLAGVEWRGRILRGNDRLTPGEVHYLRHVVVGQEWPETITFGEYLQSLRDVILDDHSGVLTSRYRGAWQLAVVGRSPELRLPDGLP